MMQSPKETVRREYLIRLHNMKSIDVKEVSDTICNRLMAFDELNDAKHIASYAATEFEIDLEKYLSSARERGTMVYYPRFNYLNDSYELALVHNPKSDLVRGKFGISEPKTGSAIISEAIRIYELMWLVPGIAFDLKCQRLGRGLGYYDRLLKGTKGKRIGIAYDWQIVTEVPVETGDAPMHCVITDKRRLICTRS
jgi:5-formyltetrahydrofolate cyclo-ligase